MATVNKDFKIKSGLIVEGTTATVNGFDILTKKTADQNYIIGLIGGAATSDATPDTVVLRDENADFSAGTITADLIGDVTGTVSDISNHSTSDLSEGTNKYFTDQRAVTANTGLWDTIGDAAAAQAAAEATASADATTKANAAQAAAELTASNALSAAVTDLEGQIADAETDAVATANAYTDGRETAITSAYHTYADQAELDAIASAAADATTKADAAQAAAEDYADALINDASNSSTEVWSAYKTSTEIGLAQAAAETHADEAVAALVGSAPELLDTLQELATALDNDPDAINSLQNIAAGKQDTLETGNGIVIDDNLIYIPTSIDSGISITPSMVEIDRAEVDTWYDANGAATTAQSNAQTFATNADTTLYGTVTSDIATAKDEAGVIAQGYANTAEQNAESYAQNLDGATNDRIDDLNTNDIAEGTNLYFTNQRAIDALGGTIGDLTTDDIEEGLTNLYFEDGRAKSSAADLLTGANLTNITITGSGSGLTITAENGVADSNTDQLAEGTTNKYFTDQRALDAVSGSNIQPESIDITWVRREEATWTDVPTASTATVHSFSGSEGSVKYLVRVFNGGYSHVTEVLATTDSNNNVAVVEYGTIYTSEDPLATATVVWNSGASQYDLNVTTANNNSEVLVAATLLAYND